MTTPDNTSPLKGLILCGGYSTRMQEDKSQIAYHGMPQWQYVQTLLADLVTEVFISCRPEQAIHFSTAALITDQVTCGGPAAGLLSAHLLQPATAWLVVACDLPFVSRQSLSLLYTARNPAKAATAFISPFNQHPEPLLAIWEPAGLTALQQQVLTGKICPRKTLLNSDIALLENPYVAEQFNANTPDDKAFAMKKG
ncbi:NTP transferase domain-containing protein [Chitinophaga nivalis]|uniref:NTP transferase domain-containing protein n=1 Tax=Chitinophaga nivalis TaxID=2991709 RepID=A0ABT3ITU4_9BACT|nr:NTP transferase domain-containing protein [Chitinophaga nivalis]MCW3462888.1 NTP transferase domain-containing protein [Chitinophaga nivalis]MCW3487422.1 NTP transferase domain-containing protein [Chitinophaga nivalis]